MLLSILSTLIKWRNLDNISINEERYIEYMNGVNQITTTITVAPSGDVRLLQITDTHLFADNERDLLGIKTVNSYEAVIKDASKYIGQCDAILSTGDLTQDHSIASYLSFSQKIKRLEAPCYWLPGNHDMQSVMLPSLLKEGIAANKQILTPDWQIILLDSQVEGVPHGHLSEQQLAFLEEKLNEYPDKHVLIAVHHHVLPVGAAWLDQHILTNNDEFITLVRRFNNVKAVLSGHVHQAFDTVHEGIRYLASPSTCVQFKPKSDDFAVDDKQPGYRYLSLQPSGNIETIVERIKTGEFSTDENATGY